MRHILLNGRFLARRPTGVDRTATELARALQRLGRSEEKGPFRVDVAVPADAPDDDAIRSRLDLDPDCAIIRSPRKGYLWEQYDLAFLRPDQCLLSLCNVGPIWRRNQFVLIHDAQVYDAPDSYGAAFRLAYRFIQPRLARNARFLATVSRFSRERLRLRGIGENREFAVLPNGIDHFVQVAADYAILERLKLKPGGFLLAIGSTAPHKNLAMLVRACAGRQDRALPLVLVGEGRGEGAEGMWTGRVSDGELKALYQGARLFLFPSITEGFGFPPLEAMSCGCPVLASHGGAIPEACGSAAAYCDPFDVEGWTGMIDGLAANPQELGRLKEAGLARSARFRWDASAASLLRILEGRGVEDAIPPEVRQSGPDAAFNPVG